MFKQLQIKNFKSLEDVSLELRRINVIIGAPNTGKSNVLDALVLFTNTEDLRTFMRFRTPVDLVYQQDRSREILIGLDDRRLKGIFKGWEVLFYFNDQLYCRISLHGQQREKSISWNDIAVYRFWENEYSSLDPPPLRPPTGKNLLGVLLHDGKLREFVGDILSNYDLRLVLIEYEQKINIEWEREKGIAVALDFRLLSDSLRQLILHTAAVFTNSNALICFEEPEIHTFPHYVKFLAEIIAYDKNNQYIITTHNPYFLLSIIEKTRISDINVYITYMRNHTTKFRRITNDELSEILDLGPDVFFNLNRFIETEEQ